MEPAVPRPDTIQALRWGADAAFAMLAGLQHAMDRTTR